MRVAIFGTTGAGKTTLITKLQQKLPQDYKIFWETSLECPYFKEAYDEENIDQQAMNYKLDLWMLTDRMKSFAKNKNEKNVIYDRSVLDSMIFADADHKFQRINDTDYKVFKDYFQSCILPDLFRDDNKNSGFDLVVYLKVDAEVAIQRILGRGRESEVDTEYDFWRTLTEIYDKWFHKYKMMAPFMVIDGNSTDPDSYAEEVIIQIKNIEKLKCKEKQ
ncbi:deoxynucleoside kinase [Mesoplasma syrphidae]|uniref:Deoxynucleoside kinase n=1 Tax=Mesoplasma syrphidae TaxID=225999 RepID=A0A2K9BYU0_9MOLU|nr:deoxynucleoside kinase [Mesoplasma syrphidae]AUF83538.1 deoxynucleoside kinase [Mesoplasma syrphidae]